jgi:hypothetical protein
MKQFNFHLDQKVSSWMRTEFEIEAKSLKEAIKIAKEKFHRGDLDEIAWEYIDGLDNQVLQPNENNNKPTAEIYYTDDIGEIEEVFNNGVDKVENI